MLKGKIGTVLEKNVSKELDFPYKTKTVSKFKHLGVKQRFDTKKIQIQ